MFYLSSNGLAHVWVQGKLPPFLAVAGQALESFVGSLDQEAKSQTEDHNSQEHQFILALAGTVTSKLLCSSGAVPM